MRATNSWFIGKGKLNLTQYNSFTLLILQQTFCLNVLVIRWFKSIKTQICKQFGTQLVLKAIEPNLIMYENKYENKMNHYVLNTKK